MNGVPDATCLQDCQGSISKLRDRVDLVCPQALHVFCIDRIDGTEVLLKLVLGLKIHAYNSSTYPKIFLYSTYINLTAVQASEHKSTAVGEVTVLLLCTKAV